MRAAVLRISTAVLLAGPTLIAFFSGGFFDRARLVAAIVAWIGVGFVAVAADRPIPRGAPTRAAVGGLLGLGAWVLASTLWAPLAGPAWHDTQRLVLYAGVLIAAIALLRDPRAARVVEPALVAGALAIVVYGLSERLAPGLVDLIDSRSAQGRLDQPLTYWNAEGSVLAVGLVLAIRLAGTWQRAAWMRLAAAAAAPWLGAGIYLTLSRGALAALAVGVLVVVLSAPARSQLSAAALGIATAAAAACGAWLMSSVQTPPTTPRAGLAMLCWLLALSLFAALVTQRLAGRDAEDRERRTRVRLPRGTGIVAVVIVALVLAAVVVTGASQSPPAGVSAGAERLKNAGSNRYEYWDVALGMLAGDPFAGEGSGSFRVVWLRERPIREAVQDAHSLTLETGAELGVVGLALLALVLGGVGVAALRAVRERHVLAPGAAAGLAAWLVHAQLDWLWEMPAATLNAVLLAGLVLALGERTFDLREQLAAAQREGAAVRTAASAGSPGGEGRSPSLPSRTSSGAASRIIRGSSGAR